MKKFLLPMAVMSTLLAAAPGQSQTIQSIDFSPTPCERRDCWAQNQNATENAAPARHEIQHGNIRLEYSNGRKQQVASQNTAVGNSGMNGFTVRSTADPQISPDRKTVGWTQGTHQPCTDWSIGGTMFVNSQLVLFRDGKLLRILKVPGTFITGWRFWNNEKYVAVGSRWHHGLGYVRLFETNSGKLLEHWSTPAAAEKNLRWAQDLTP